MSLRELLAFLGLVVFGAVFCVAAVYIFAFAAHSVQYFHSSASLRQLRTLYSGPIDQSKYNQNPTSFDRQVIGIYGPITCHWTLPSLPMPPACLSVKTATGTEQFIRCFIDGFEISSVAIAHLQKTYSDSLETSQLHDSSLGDLTARCLPPDHQSLLVVGQINGGVVSPIGMSILFHTSPSVEEAFASAERGAFLGDWVEYIVSWPWQTGVNSSSNPSPPSGPPESTSSPLEPSSATPISAEPSTSSPLESSSSIPTSSSSPPNASPSSLGKSSPSGSDDPPTSAPAEGSRSGHDHQEL